MITERQMRPAVEATLGAIKARDGESNSFTPSKEKYFYAFPSPSRESLSEIAKNAKKAQLNWAECSFGLRRKYFRSLYNVFEENLEEIVEILRLDTGKPKHEVLLHEVIPVLDAIKVYPKIAKRALRNESRRSHLMPTQKVIVRHVPYGVVGLISPWNFPFFLSFHSIIQALVAGNAVIFKPSEHTPLTGLLIQTLIEKAGFPKQLMNTVFGDGVVGQSMILEPLISKIGFVGSTQTGRHILKLAADRILPVSLELGGKDAILVTEDADLDLAAKGAAIGAFSNSGQACTSTERIYVHRDILDVFTKKLVAAVEEATNGTGEAFGPIITGPQLGIIQEQLEDAVQNGAKVLTGGTSDRRTVAPTVLANVTKEMLVLQEETFGPLLPIIPYDTEEEAIAEINNSNYGLSGAVFCGNKKRAIDLASQMESGHVMINATLTSPSITEAPWGGFKESGLGRSNGVEGLQSYTQIQSIIRDRVPRISQLFAFPYTTKKYGWLMRMAKVFRYLPT